VSDPEEDDRWDDYESGPFCRHWSDPSDCDIACAGCGHSCTEHGASDGDRACMQPECNCGEWTEV
jgi:hypothetical protein